MRVRIISFLLIVFLLLSSLAMPSIACPPPDCGSCCHWVSTGPDPSDGYCELDTDAECGGCSGCSPCNSCIACFCIWDCIIPGATCCNGICCNSGNFCNSTTCCSNYDDVCCTDSGSYCCDSGKTCCQGSCCGSTQCCDGGTCVPKCTNTGECDYGVEPSGPYISCPNPDPTVIGVCTPGVEGTLCNHRLIRALNDAECADCEPSCDKTRICACAEITPVFCHEECFIVVCSCLCTQGGMPEYRGDHYECD